MRKFRLEKPEGPEIWPCYRLEDRFLELQMLEEVTYLFLSNG